MSAIKGLRQGPRRESHVRLFALISPEAKAIVDDAAASLGISKATIVEQILRRVEVDEHGRPSWWQEVAPNTVPDQGELPLKTA